MRRRSRWRRGGINEEREKNRQRRRIGKRRRRERRRRRRGRVGGRRKQVWLPRSQDFPSCCSLADKYSHFPKNKSNFPANNKYGWWSLLNWPATPAAAFGHKTPK